MYGSLKSMTWTSINMIQYLKRALYINGNHFLHFGKIRKKMSIKFAMMEYFHSKFSSGYHVGNFFQQKFNKSMFCEFKYLKFLKYFCLSLSSLYCIIHCSFLFSFHSFKCINGFYVRHQRKHQMGKLMPAETAKNSRRFCLFMFIIGLVKLCGWWSEKGSF